MTGLTTFYSCRYHRFVTVLSIKIGPISPCLLSAHSTVHFADSMRIFRGPEPRALLVNELVEVGMGYLIKQQFKVALFTLLQTLP
jgi:hypothetical protein